VAIPILIAAIARATGREARVGDTGIVVSRDAGFVVTGGVADPVGGDWGSSLSETCFVSPALRVYVPDAGT
jgi:hypothetical protein